jgi:hypothetical protein
LEFRSQNLEIRIVILFLTRTYFPDGTNGMLLIDAQLVCYTIELPWKENQARISCIPEGKYFIKKRYSQKYGWHLEVCDVPNRTYILFHPANDAQQELQGCIAPVTTLTGAGKGNLSKQAFMLLLHYVYAALDNDESVLLIVQSNSPN